MLAPNSAAERGLAYLDPTRVRPVDPGRSAATHTLNPTDRQRGPLPFRTARQIAEETPDETEWVVPGYLAIGALSEFDGKVKAGGKTTLLTNMARSIVDGGVFLEQQTQKTAVVYLTEQPPSSFRRALARAGLLDRDDFHVLYWAETRDWPWPDVVREATVYAESVGAKVMIVDTLPQWAGLQGDSENNSGAALAAVAPLQEAAALHNLAVAVVRHERKGSGEVGESARGSSAFAGAVDIIVQIKRGEGNSRPSIRILMSLSRYDETPDELVIELTEAGYLSLIHI